MIYINNEKTGLLYNIKKNRVLKKLASKQDINIYSNLDETLKKDREIQFLALQCVKDKKDFNLFPEDFLYENISNCSDEIQRNFTSWTAYGTGIKYLSQSMQYKLVEEDNKYFSLVSPEDRKKLVLMDNELFKRLSTTEKIALIKDNAELISLCDEKTIEENIRDISVETVLTYAKMKNLELDKYFYLMKLKYDYNNPKEYMVLDQVFCHQSISNNFLFHCNTLLLSSSPNRRKLFLLFSALLSTCLGLQILLHAPNNRVLSHQRLLPFANY